MTNDRLERKTARKREIVMYHNYIEVKMEMLKR